MKRIFTILATILLTAGVFLPLQAGAQSPDKMSYQAVIRDASDKLVTNRSVGMQVSILQGSANGTAVYAETQTPTTNANGLVSIEIGTGTTSDDFSTIDWANGPYFIKTETDPVGGTSYSITGTSQLLSVPYALHAKTAETITGGMTETDPVYTASEAANITAADMNNLDNLSGTNTGDQDISGIAANATAIAENEQAIQDTASQIRGDIPDVSGFVSTETDPVYTASEAANITAADINNLDNLSGTNTGDQDISGIAANAQAIQDTASQIRADIPDISGFISSESDPVFVADSSNFKTAIRTNTQAIQDTASQIRADIPDVSGFVTTETDPEYTASIASGITGTDTTNWNNKLDSYTEVDPSVPTGAQTGDMQYWDGSAWVIVEATEYEGAALQFIGGVPTWVGGPQPGCYAGCNQQHRCRCLWRPVPMGTRSRWT